MCAPSGTLRGTPKAALHDYIDLVYYVLFESSDLFIFVRQIFLKQRKGLSLVDWNVCSRKKYCSTTFYHPLGVTFVGHGSVYTNYVLVSAALIIGYHSNYISILFYCNIIVLFARYHNVTELLL